ncbi:heparan sulfate glucosamine 3-O-sulfotransferase 5-like isoform X2 [Hemibagrus wyckioides]|nr:heparan sulfate glucosamine 3-O-sulfotransferase 5-like isoform X2 [Hemibagrus wyckioides]
MKITALNGLYLTGHLSSKVCLMGEMFLQQLLLGSLVVGTLLYLITHLGHLDRVQVVCPTENMTCAAGVSVQHEQGVLYVQRRGGVTRGHLVQQLPHAIIIGVRKGGTRALLEMLSLHPAVVKASQEVHFFDSDENYGQGFTWYRSRMPLSLIDHVTIEKSPAYFTTEKVPERIFRMNASVKLLLIVRDPVTRAISDYAQVLEGKHRKNKTYPGFESLALDGATRSVNTKYKAVSSSVYTKHLEHWLHFFPVQQLHVVDGDRLISDPLPELQMVEKFLSLTPRISRDNLYFNATRGFYCLRSERNRVRRCLAGSKGRAHPHVRPAVLDKLRLYFHPYNQKFYQITGRTFNWP